MTARSPRRQRRGGVTADGSVFRSRPRPSRDTAPTNSKRPSTASCRPGHEGPTRAELEAAKAAVVSEEVEQLDDPGGFGGLADRLNLYNHYYGIPTHRLGSPAPVGCQCRRRPGLAARQLRRDGRVLISVAPPEGAPPDTPRPERNGATGSPGAPAGAPGPLRGAGGRGEHLLAGRPR